MKDFSKKKLLKIGVMNNNIFLYNIFTNYIYYFIINISIYLMHEGKLNYSITRDLFINKEQTR